MPIRLTDLRLSRPLLPRTPLTYRIWLVGDSTAMPHDVRAEEGTALH